MKQNSKKKIRGWYLLIISIGFAAIGSQWEESIARELISVFCFILFITGIIKSIQEIRLKIKERRAKTTSIQQ